MSLTGLFIQSWLSHHNVLRCLLSVSHFGDCYLKPESHQTAAFPGDSFPAVSHLPFGQPGKQRIYSQIWDPSLVEEHMHHTD